MEHIAIFAYDFPHRKSHDFILDLRGAGLKNLIVFGAPRRDLGHLANRLSVTSSPAIFTAVATADLCRNLEIPYFVIEHNDIKGLEILRSKYDSNLAIISGARILPANVIALFDKGVINFHPGKIPETSGLDAFLYTLKHGVSAGVTTHFIDHRVDAGSLIRYNELHVNPGDTPHDIAENTYQLQRIALRQLVNDIKTGNIARRPIIRPTKNVPMSIEEQWKCLDSFNLWKSRRVFRQMRQKLFDVCERGEMPAVLEMLEQDSELISETNDRGWTPLIVACFNQRLDVARLLLLRGADPNRGGANGTTPLMYAKTKLLNRPDQSYELLEMLLDRGADCRRTDAFGNTVLHYVEQAADDRLATFFRKYLLMH